MTSSIDFGTLSTSLGAPRLLGTSSQLDTEALIHALVDAKRLPALRLEQRIDRNQARIAAFGDLKALLTDLRNIANALRNPPGFLGHQQNIFEQKAAFFTSSTATNPGELLAVNVASQAQPGRFDLVVHQVASARKLAADSVADASATLAEGLNGGGAFAGSFTIGLEGSGSTATIEVTGDMTLNDLRARINATADQSGVRAQVLKVADGDHRLVLTAQETGKEVVLSPAGGDDVLAIVGLSEDGGASFKHGLQEARPALFEIDGVAMTRSSNTVGDAIDGLTLSLFRADPATTITVEVERDVGLVKEQIRQFVEAFNHFRSFVAAQQEVGAEGELGEHAVLFGSHVLRGVDRAIGSTLAGQVHGLDPEAVATLRGLGITLNQQNRLVIDEGRLDQMLLNDLDGVRRVFEFSLESSNGQLTVLKRTNALAAQHFTVNIVDADGDGIIDAADIDGIAVEVDGRTIKGLAGTPYEGLELFWTGAGSVSIEVTATQGLADRLYNHLEATLRPVSGTIDQEILSLERGNDRHLKQIERIEERALRYRDQLIERFMAMERALALADAMMRQLRTQIDAMFQQK